MKTINIEDLMENFENYVLVDLRSPVEFEKDTIKGSINIPILDNEARHLVGTIYKQDKESAYIEGFKIGSSKMPNIYEKIKEIKEDNPDKEIVVFCFRGGTRSSSVHSMLSILKLETIKLEGGYKVYRSFLLSNLEKYISELKLLVLTGHTGAGKTILLNGLEKKEYPVIDLEKMANNRGSVFGSIGLGDKVSQKYFDTELYFKLRKHFKKNETMFFVESESIKIGNINLPPKLYNKMCNSPHILIKPSLEKRVEIISRDYNIDTIPQKYILGLLERNEYFKKLMGKEKINECIDLIKNHEYNKFIEIMLVDYYDKLYQKSHDQYNYIASFNSDDFEAMEKELIKILKKESA